MANTCSICSHPERESIEKEIVVGTSNRAIACHFDVGRMAVARHKDNCIKPAVAAVQAEREIHFVWNALEEMEWLHTEARAIYSLAKGAGDYSASIKALGEIRQQMKLFNELLQGHDPGQAERLEQEWVLLRETIFAVLDPYPDVQLAMTRALLALKNNHDYQSDRQLLPEESTTKPDSDG